MKFFGRENLLEQLAEHAGREVVLYDSWFDAFRALSEALPRTGRCVVLLGEVSWMAK